MRPKAAVEMKTADMRDLRQGNIAGVCHGLTLVPSCFISKRGIWSLAMLGALALAGVI